MVSLWFTHTKHQPVFSIPFLIWQWPFDKCYPSWQSTCSVEEWAPTSWRWRIQSLSVQSIWCNWNPGTENYKKKLQWELQQINSNKYRSILRHYQEIWKNEKNYNNFSRLIHNKMNTFLIHFQVFFLSHAVSEYDIVNHAMPRSDHRKSFVFFFQFYKSFMQLIKTTVWKLNKGWSYWILKSHTLSSRHRTVNHIRQMFTRAVYTIIPSFFRQQIDTLSH